MTNNGSCKVILASGSPRRRELLVMLGVPFDIMVSSAEEEATATHPAEVTEQLSCKKAQEVAARLQSAGEENYVVIGADTVVSVDGRILGKPADREEAREMIGLLQGRQHMVYTGVTLVIGQGREQKTVTFSQGTRVSVAPMTEGEIRDYIGTPEPYDKAGAYGIQGSFAKYVQGIEGDYYNVVGLPVHELYQHLKKELPCGILYKTSK